MSTSNFYCKNTSKIYAIENNEEFAQYDCQVSLECLGWMPCDESDRNDSRSYPANIIGEKTNCVVVAGVSIDITAKAKIVSGYFSGACFDFDCELAVYDRDGYLVSTYDTLDSIYKYIDSDEIIKDNWTGNKGLSKIHAGRIYKAMQQAINELQKEAEKAFSECCSDSLLCVGVFSNGEALYTRL